MHAVWIEAGGIVPLPRAGGALSHAVASIRNLQRHCQAEFHGPFPHRLLGRFMVEVSPPLPSAPWN